MIIPIPFIYSGYNKTFYALAGKWVKLFQLCLPPLIEEIIGYFHHAVKSQSLRQELFYINVQQSVVSASPIILSQCCVYTMYTEFDSRVTTT